MAFGPPAQITWCDYDPASHRFIIPVLLPRDNDTKLKLEGFYSAAGVASDPVVIRCQIGTNSYSRAQRDLVAKAAKDPKLEQLLTAMKAARARLTSGIETVRWAMLVAENESFRSIKSHSATFKWQGTNQAWADISQLINWKAFILGNDGATCWLYSENPQDERRFDRSPTAMVPDINTSFADPFALTQRTVEAAIAKERLVYAGEAQLAGRKCHRVWNWMVRQPKGDDYMFAVRREWWIDAKTLLPVHLIEDGSSCRQVFDFHFENLNRPIPIADFRPPARAEKGAKAVLYKDAPGPDEKRFITIRDGSDGRMSARIGVSGPNGRTSSGLN